MGFMNKEDMILDGLLDYMENTLPARKPVPDEQALKEQTREELIDKVTEGSGKRRQVRQNFLIC